jgi:SSS family solute:Na+ symporter
VFVIGVGIYYRKRSNTTDGYLVAGRSQGTFSITSTMLGSVLGSVAFIGFVGLGYLSGVNGLFFWAIPAGLATLTLVFAFGRVIRRTGLYTVPDVFTLRFGKKAALVTTLVQMIFIIPHVAITFIAMGVVFSTFFDISTDLGVLIGFVVISIYVFFGGFHAVIGTDKVQLLVVLLGLVLLFAFSLNYAGGIETVLNNTPGEHWNPLGKSSLIDFLFLTLSIAPFYLIQQSHWQRIFASKDIKVVRKGFTIGVLLATCIFFGSFFIGIIARTYLPGGLHPDMVFAEALSTVFPVAIAGLLLIGLMAAIMSSADTFILSGAAVTTRNVYQQYLRPQATDSQMLQVSRYSVLLVATLGLGIALFGGGIIPTALLSMKIVGSGLVFPFLALMFWRRATLKGIISGMILGVLVTIIWEIADNPLGMQAIPGYIASLVAIIVVSLFTSHAPEEKVEALYFAPKKSPEVE